MIFRNDPEAVAFLEDPAYIEAQRSKCLMHIRPMLTFHNDSENCCQPYHDYSWDGESPHTIHGRTEDYTSKCFFGGYVPKECYSIEPASGRILDLWVTDAEEAFDQDEPWMDLVAAHKAEQMGRNYLKRGNTLIEDPSEIRQIPVQRGLPAEQRQDIP